MHALLFCSGTKCVNMYHIYLNLFSRPKPYLFCLPLVAKHRSRTSDLQTSVERKVGKQKQESGVRRMNLPKAFPDFFLFISLDLKSVHHIWNVQNLAAGYHTQRGHWENLCYQCLSVLWELSVVMSQQNKNRWSRWKVLFWHSVASKWNCG